MHNMDFIKVLTMQISTVESIGKTSEYKNEAG